jgi:hypothetical protein
VRIEIEAPDRIKAAAVLVARATLLNDTFEPVEVNRQAFIGPDLVTGGLSPENVEATLGAHDEPLLLQPFTYYGRERELGIAPPGIVEITARYELPAGQVVRASRSVTVESG